MQCFNSEDWTGKYSRQNKHGGYRIDYIYQGDPDYADFSDWKSPLNDPYLDIREGDIITKVNGRDVLSDGDVNMPRPLILVIDWIS